MAEFVVIAFGLFFVFSEKQLPDKKIRNIRKTLIIKPASFISRRLSSSSTISVRASTISSQVTAIVLIASNPKVQH